MFLNRTKRRKKDEYNKEGSFLYCVYTDPYFDWGQRSSRKDNVSRRDFVVGGFDWSNPYHHYRVRPKRSMVILLDFLAGSLACPMD